MIDLEDLCECMIQYGSGVSKIIYIYMYNFFLHSNKIQLLVVRCRRKSAHQVFNDPIVYLVYIGKKKLPIR